MKIQKFLAIGILALGLVGCSSASKDTTTAVKAPTEEARKGEITTLKSTVRLQDGFKVVAESRGFTFVMDEPTEEGGTNTGMNPCEAVLGAFGGCQTIVASAYAKSMGIDLQEYWVELEGDFDMGGFEGVEGVFPGYTEVRYTIHIKSTSSKEKIDEFIEFVEKVCPVGNTLASPVKMVKTNVIIEK